ncbi:hypothetical protein [Pelagibacterium luteolum]|uniref:Uncharacterized protein n=1 Tax=Pelagibacterium luteolum TaxID=440168 RepID=A0A1G7THJ0_9HYPH|nr:hypothetical protein [Pelagibacterium luteolum]SDG34484.1 hypothetical protein SAMN04487974_102120 [Pelagibacterium luteolum]
MAENPYQQRGLLSMLGQGDSGFAQWLDPRRNAIIGFGSGLIGADSARGAMRGAAQGMQQGRQQDTQYAVLQQEQAERQEQLAQQTAERNQTVEWLKSNYPQYAALPPAEGFRAAMADMGRASSGGANEETFFGSPVPYQTEDGVQYGQLGNQGTFRPIPLPDGASFAPRTSQVDIGNAISVQDQHGNELYRMPKSGSVPTGFEPQQGGGIAPMAGGPQAEERERSQAQAAQRSEQTARAATIVLDDINRAREIVKSDNFFNPSVGFGSGLARNVEGSNATNLFQLTQTIRGNIGFDRLQQMRESSPTGGALGNVTEQELATLQSVLGSLDQSQNEQQFLYNLDRLEEIYGGIMRKAAAYPNAAEFGFGSGSPGGAGGGVVDYNDYF